MHILLGILITAVGVAIVWQSEWFLRNLGRIEWAEQKLGLEGGSRLFYKLIGLIVAFLGLFVMTGIWNDIMEGFAKLFVR